MAGWSYVVACGWIGLAQLIIYVLARFGERGRYMRPYNWECFKSKNFISTLWLTSAYILPAAIVVVAIAGAIVGRENRPIITLCCFIICL